jgi:hypothetical protein
MGENKMRLALPVMTAALFMISSANSASAQNVQKLVGTWVGTTHSYMVGSDGNLPVGGGTWENPKPFAANMEIKILKQDERRFMGEFTIGNKPQGGFIGVLSVDGKEFAAITERGEAWGRVIGRNKLSVCYSNLPGPKSPNTSVGCTDIRRKK